MTQVQEISSDGLRREFSITVPSALVEQAMTTRLQEVGKTAKIQGFRPGKVPMAILKQRFGQSLRHEVFDKALNDGVERTLSERNLRPAMQPKVDIISMEDGKDLAFKLTVEVLPEIGVLDFSKLSFERAVVDVADKIIDEAITHMAKNAREPELVTEKRAAKLGDVVVIDFDGSVDGEAKPGMKGEDHRLELGTKSFIDTFEDQLVGAKAGDKKTIKVTFPADYHAKDLAGKAAVFEVTVKELRAPKPVSIDDDLAKELGFTDLADMRKLVADQLGANYARTSRAVMKRQLMDKLAEQNSFAVPPGLVEAEFNAIWQQVQKDKKAGSLPEDEAKKSDDELRADYTKIAERRVRLGLILADVSERNKIDVTQQELSNAVIAEARRFPGQEQAVVNYYVKTKGAVERLRAPILEEKIVDFVLAQAKISERKVSAEELAKLPEMVD